jgi:hypothetical protein
MLPNDIARASFQIDEEGDSTVAGCSRFGHLPRMSTLAEIESAVERLPARQKEELLAFLAKQLGRAVRARTRRGLKAAGRPALEGLPADLSTGTKERVRALIAKRHAANR